MEKKNKSRGLKEILELTLKLEDGVDVRKNLIELKSGLKELSKKDTYKLTEYFEDSEELVEELLNNEDAKVRKNIALVLGQLSCQKYLKKLYAAYKNESQLFVRSSYLEAMQNLDVDKIVEELRSDYKKASEALKNADEADKKHYLEECTAFKQLLSDFVDASPEGAAAKSAESDRKASVKLRGREVNCLLTINGGFEKLLDEEVSKRGGVRPMVHAPVKGGVVVRSSELDDVLKIRIYNEALFFLSIKELTRDMLKPIKVSSAKESVRKTAEECAKLVIKNGLLELLKTVGALYSVAYFRTEIRIPAKIKAVFDDRKKNELSRLFSQFLALESENSLENKPSDYLFEIRLIFNEELDSFLPLVKFMRPADTRFSYRKSSGAFAMKPYVAALCAKLAEGYMKDHAQVLDPFCGCGTLLIERGKLKKCRDEYGLDIKENEIVSARENSERAGSQINYINRDFFDFKHEYLFDEIITDMPFVMNEDQDKIQILKKIYEKFFNSSINYLNLDGIVVIYTHNKDYVQKFKGKNLEIVEEFAISKKDRTDLVILKVISEKN